jgi:ABC-type sulfate transport system substrate-binding protein
LDTIIEESGKIDKEINQKIVKAGRLYNSLRITFLGKKEIPKKIKTQVYQKVVRPSIVYSIRQ